MYATQAQDIEAGVPAQEPTQTVVQVADHPAAQCQVPQQSTLPGTGAATLIPHQAQAATGSLQQAQQLPDQGIQTGDPKVVSPREIVQTEYHPAAQHQVPQQSTVLGSGAADLIPHQAQAVTGSLQEAQQLPDQGIQAGDPKVVSSREIVQTEYHRAAQRQVPQQSSVPGTGAATLNPHEAQAVTGSLQQAQQLPDKNNPPMKRTNCSEQYNKTPYANTRRGKNKIISELAKNYLSDTTELRTTSAKLPNLDPPPLMLRALAWEINFYEPLTSMQIAKNRAKRIAKEKQKNQLFMEQGIKAGDPKVVSPREIVQTEYHPAAQRQVPQQSTVPGTGASTLIPQEAQAVTGSLQQAQQLPDKNNPPMKTRNCSEQYNKTPYANTRRGKNKIISELAKNYLSDSTELPTTSAKLPNLDPPPLMLRALAWEINFYEPFTSMQIDKNRAKRIAKEKQKNQLFMDQGIKAGDPKVVSAREIVQTEYHPAAQRQAPQQSTVPGTGAATLIPQEAQAVTGSLQQAQQLPDKNNPPMKRTNCSEQYNKTPYANTIRAKNKIISELAKKHLSVSTELPTTSAKLPNFDPSPHMLRALADWGINYYEPLTPMQIAKNRAERIANEKQKNQLFMDQGIKAGDPKVVSPREIVQTEYHPAAQRQAPQQSTVPGTGAATLIPQEAQAVTGSLQQAQQLPDKNNPPMKRTNCSEQYNKTPYANTILAKNKIISELAKKHLSVSTELPTTSAKLPNFDPSPHMLRALADWGINYYEPRTPMQIAKNRAERIANEKQKNQLFMDQGIKAGDPKVVSPREIVQTVYHPAAQRQAPQQSTVPGTGAATLIPQEAQAVTGSLQQAQQLPDQGIQTGDPKVVSPREIVQTEYNPAAQRQVPQQSTVPGTGAATLNPHQAQAVTGSLQDAQQDQGIQTGDPKVVSPREIVQTEYNPAAQRQVPQQSTVPGTGAATLNPHQAQAVTGSLQDAQQLPDKNNPPMKTTNCSEQYNKTPYANTIRAKNKIISELAKKRLSVSTELPNTSAKLPNLDPPPHMLRALADWGINYYEPLTPMQIAKNRAERIAKEKQKNQLFMDQGIKAGDPKVVSPQEIIQSDYHPAAQRQVPQKSTVPGTGAATLIPHEAQAVTGSLQQAQQLPDQGIQTVDPKVVSPREIVQTEYNPAAQRQVPQQSTVPGTGAATLNPHQAQAVTGSLQDAQQLPDQGIQAGDPKVVSPREIVQTEYHPAGQHEVPQQSTVPGTGAATLIPHEAQAVTGSLQQAQQLPDKNNPPMKTTNCSEEYNKTPYANTIRAKNKIISELAKKRLSVSTELPNTSAKLPNVDPPPHMLRALADWGINYYEPLTPMQIAKNRAERIANEKQKNQLFMDQGIKDGDSKVVSPREIVQTEYHPAAQRQVPQQSTVPGTGAATLIPHVAQVVTGSLQQAQQLPGQGIKAGDPKVVSPREIVQTEYQPAAQRQVPQQSTVPGTCAATLIPQQAQAVTGSLQQAQQLPDEGIQAGDPKVVSPREIVQTEYQPAAQRQVPQQSTVPGTCAATLIPHQAQGVTGSLQQAQQLPEIRKTICSTKDQGFQAIVAEQVSSPAIVQIEYEPYAQLQVPQESTVTETGASRLIPHQGQGVVGSLVQAQQLQPLISITKETMKLDLLPKLRDMLKESDITISAQTSSKVSKGGVAKLIECIDHPEDEDDANDEDLLIHLKHNVNNKTPLISSVSESTKEPLKKQQTGDNSCAKCHFSSSNREDFKKHILSHKSNQTTFQCQECGLCFVTIASLTKHLFIVHKIRDTKKYLSEENINFNYDLESNTKESECSVCLASFPTEACLKRHFRSHGMAFILSIKSERL